MSYDSDLEEGEIPNSPSPSISEKKNKNLPRRYVLRENKGVHHKHKKSCRDVIRYHAKKIAKRMKTPAKMKDFSKHKSKSYLCKKHNKYIGARFDNSEHSRLTKCLRNSFKTQSLIPEMVISPKVDSSCNIENPNIVTDIKNEESEDEEELRRIALASCSRKNLNCEQSYKDMFTNVNNVDIVPKSVNSTDIPNICHENVTDNYEVVDMEVDEDYDQNSGEVLHNDNLFIIDTNPTNLQGDNKSLEPETSRVQNVESDDEFEEDILRAELISSLIRKRYKNDPVIESDDNPDSYVKETLFQNSSQHIFKKQSIKDAAKFKSKKLSVSKVNGSAKKRFVISLKGESSDESEHEDPTPDNAVASLEALISDARQKSSLNEKTNDDLSNISTAVSCLSKAQQKEYNTLRKLLAKREKGSQICKQDNKIESSRLKILETKLNGTRASLEKEKELLTKLSEEVSKMWSSYAESKLKVHMIKAQFVVAEKARREKLALWSKAYREFDVKKKSVSNLEKKINNLQKLCSKVGSDIQR